MGNVLRAVRFSDGVEFVEDIHRRALLDHLTQSCLRHRRAKPLYFRPQRPGRHAATAQQEPRRPTRAAHHQGERPPRPRHRTRLEGHEVKVKRKWREVMGYRVSSAARFGEEETRRGKCAALELNRKPPPGFCPSGGHLVPVELRVSEVMTYLTGCAWGRRCDP